MKKSICYLFVVMLVLPECKSRKNSALVPEQAVRKVQALLIGMESFDIASYKKLGLTYNYNNGATAGAKKDMSNFKSIIRKAGIQDQNITELFTKSATIENIREQLRRIGGQLSAEDVFIFYFTGHGDSILNTDAHEKEKYDQFLVTYNNRLIDDEINRCFQQFFNAGVNIIMVVDACHSGSTFEFQSFCNVTPDTDRSHPVRIIYLGATADNDEAIGTSSGSLFTYYLHKTYFDLIDDGDLDKVDYEKFLNKVQQQITCHQKVQYKIRGEVNPSLISKPFKFN